MSPNMLDPPKGFLAVGDRDSTGRTDGDFPYREATRKPTPIGQVYEQGIPSPERRRRESWDGSLRPLFRNAGGHFTADQLLVTKPVAESKVTPAPVMSSVIVRR